MAKIEEYDETVKVGAVTFSYHCDLWWYDTPEGQMCCPPNVQTRRDIAAYFGLDLPQDPVKEPKVAHNYKRVAQYDTDGYLVAVHDSVLEAARSVGCSPCSISNIVAGRSALAGGYRWRRVQKGREPETRIQPYRKIR